MTLFAYWKAAIKGVRGGAPLKEDASPASAEISMATEADRAATPEVRVSDTLVAGLAKYLAPVISEPTYAGDLDRDLLAVVVRILGGEKVPVLERDLHLDPAVAQRLADLRNLTNGARQAVRGSKTFQAAVSVTLADRDMKKFLRESVGNEGDLRRLNSLLAQKGIPASDSGQGTPKALASSIKGINLQQVARPLQIVAPNKTVREVVPSRGGVKTRKGSEAGNGSGVKQAKAVRQPTSNAEHTELRGTPVTLSDAGKAVLDVHLKREFVFKSAGETYQCRLETLLARLESRGQSGAVRDALNGLFRSDLRFLLPKIVGLVRSQDIKFDPVNDALVRVFAVRLYVQLNAVRSGEAIARELRAREDLFGVLSSGEQRRIQDLLARCALRSGRPHDAIRMFRDIVTDRPDDGAALMNYVTTVFTTDVRQALSYAKTLILNRYALADENMVFLGDLLAHNGEHDLAQVAFFRILQDNKNYADAYLGLANLALLTHDSTQWEAWLKRFFACHKLPTFSVRGEEVPAPFRLKSPALKSVTSSPKVTVIMTSFNSGRTIEVAVESVLNQTVTNLELFIVDDVSTDNSREIIKSLAARDARIRYIFNERNVGTYSSKNAAILQASGDFVTFHDSDDWMYEQRLERHLEAMRPSVGCSISNWVRMDAAGRSIVRLGGAYVHLNPASTFFRREVLESIGMFDYVRTGADSEILTRVRHRLGLAAVAQLPNVLGIGFHHEASLTQSGSTAFDEHRYSPVRLEYTESWVQWHLATLVSNREALSIADQAHRLFEAPEAIAP